MQFLADLMLKKLARWLRVLGVSTLYAGDFRIREDDELIKLALKKKAVLLTRDEKLFNKARDYAQVLLIKSIYLSKQLKQVLKEFKIKTNFPEKTLCPQCNSRLKQVGKKVVKQKVFPAVYKAHSIFWVCINKQCGKVYWQGSHWKKIETVINKIMQ